MLDTQYGPAAGAADFNKVQLTCGFHKREGDRGLGFEILGLGAYGLGSGCSVRLWVSSFQFRVQKLRLLVRYILLFEMEGRPEELIQASNITQKHVWVYSMITLERKDQLCSCID